MLKDCQNDMTNIWQMMKEITGESKVTSNRFPKSINVQGKSIKRNSPIAEKFDKYLTKLGPARYKTHQKHVKIFYFPYRIIFSLLKNLKKLLSQ